MVWLVVLVILCPGVAFAAGTVVRCHSLEENVRQVAITSNGNVHKQSAWALEEHTMLSPQCCIVPCMKGLQPVA